MDLAVVLIQLWPLAHKRLNKHYEIFREQILPLKCSQPIKIVMYFEKGFRSFSFNKGSVDKRAAKLLAVKLGGLKKVCRSCCYSPNVCKRVWPGFDFNQV